MRSPHNRRDSPHEGTHSTHGCHRRGRGWRCARGRRLRRRRQHAVQTDQRAATGQASAQSQPGRTGGNGETPLTGDTAQKVKDAAQAAVPGGTVERVSNDTDGVSGAVYEAHATEADGTRVELQFDKDYKLLATNPDKGRGGHGGSGRGNRVSPLP